MHEWLSVPIFIHGVPHRSPKVGVSTPKVRLLWSESGTNLLRCCMLSRVWFVFTRQHLQVDQNV